jgi:nicotinamide-nucleotide amidase
MKAIIIAIGDELLIGQVLDSNSHYLAGQLDLLGYEVERSFIIGDREDALTELLSLYSQQEVVVITTGGLGPTDDDKTRVVLASFFGRPLELHEPTLNAMRGFLEKTGKTVTEFHSSQALIPRGSNVLSNQLGTAPGIHISQGNMQVFSVPGVPYEMKYLFHNGIKPILEKNFKGNKRIHRTMLTAGVAESVLAEKLIPFEKKLPDKISLAYLPRVGQVRLRLTAKDSGEDTLNQYNQAVENLYQELGEWIYGENEESLPMVIGQLSNRLSWKIGTAESCTGGKVANEITSVSGSSSYFQGGVVTYSNELKESILKVNRQTLIKYGAVSSETVEEMVKGGLDALDVDVCVAISGIAGPGGGTPGKPVGTIWIGVGNNQRIEKHLIRGGKDRIRNIEFATTQALNLLRLFLLKFV